MERTSEAGTVGLFRVVEMNEQCGNVLPGNLKNVSKAKKYPHQAEKYLAMVTMTRDRLLRKFASGESHFVERTSSPPRPSPS